MITFIATSLAVVFAFTSNAYAQLPNESHSTVRKVKTIKIPGARWTSCFDPKLGRIAVVRETLREYRTSVFSLAEESEVCEFRQPSQFRSYGVGIHSISFLGNENENELLIVDTEGRLVFCDIKRKVIDRVIRLPWFVLHDQKIAKEFEDSKRPLGNVDVTVLHGLRILSAKMMPNGENMVVLYDDGTIVVLDINSGHLGKTVRKGSYQSSVAEFGKDVDAKLMKTLPQFFGMRLSKSIDWVIPNNIRIGKKPDSTDRLLLGCVGGDVITSDRKGIARLNLDESAERWRTDSGYRQSKLTSNLKLIAVTETHAICLYGVADGKLVERIPIEGIRKKDRLVDIKTDAAGDVFLLQSQEHRMFLVNRHGKSTEIDRNELADGTVYRFELASDGSKFALLINDATVESYEVKQ